MADISTVNTQVLDSIAAVTQATMPPFHPEASGLGKAVQSVAQSAAIAVQDATDNLRNSMTIATTAIGVAMAQLLATGDDSYSSAISTAQGVINQAATQFSTIGTDAANVLSGFRFDPPSGNGNQG